MCSNQRRQWSRIGMSRRVTSTKPAFATSANRRPIRSFETFASTWTTIWLMGLPPIERRSCCLELSVDSSSGSATETPSRSVWSGKTASLGMGEKSQVAWRGEDGAGAGDVLDPAGGSSAASWQATTSGISERSRGDLTTVRSDTGGCQTFPRRYRALRPVVEHVAAHPAAIGLGRTRAHPACAHGFRYLVEQAWGRAATSGSKHAPYQQHQANIRGEMRCKPWRNGGGLAATATLTRVGAALCVARRCRPSR